MNSSFYWLLVWSDAVGFQWPTPPPWPTTQASRLRASSPRPDQGGISKPSYGGSAPHSSPSPGAFTPQSGFACRRLASLDHFANPTTPASAAGDVRPSDSPPSVPSLCSADAAGSQVPLAPTRSSTSRVWSAYADDRERSAFPLEPPSFALRWRPRFGGAFASLENSSVALRHFRVSQAFSEAGRYV